MIQVEVSLVTSQIALLVLIRHKGLILVSLAFK